jgi:hypothetical protein
MGLPMRDQGVQIFFVQLNFIYRRISVKGADYPLPPVGLIGTVELRAIMHKTV